MSMSQDLSYLLEFVGSSARPSDIGRIVIRAFLLTLAKRGLSKLTIVRRFFGIKALTRWMLNEGIIADDFAEGIHGLKGPKLPDRLPLVPSPREMEILLNGDFPTAFPERDRLICELLYGQGCAFQKRPASRLTICGQSSGPFTFAARAGCTAKRGNSAWCR
jgi:site-specific recombinase XerD